MDSASFCSRILTVGLKKWDFLTLHSKLAYIHEEKHIVLLKNRFVFL